MTAKQMAIPEVETEFQAGFRHEALIYSDSDAFLARALPFVRAAVEAGEPVLVAVSDRNVGLLGRELGSAAAEVRFAAIEQLARNPARMISFWWGFLEEHEGDPVRGIEELVWPGRSGAEIDECERHEALLNVAFPADAPISLLCAYDGSTLPEEVIGGVPSCHQLVLSDDAVQSGGDRHAGRDFFAGGLPPRPVDATSFEFDRDGLAEVRHRTKRAADAAGLSRPAAADLVVAASELAANSVAHGGGRGTLRTWREGDRLLVEFEDSGWISEPLVGRLRPAITQEGGRGLWLANQLCDLLQIRSGSAGTVVRLQAARA
ncbi:MAG TPA: sensor histidine kinase [Solirubrobacterales bacterium]|nr:sensor histidine kinase [Solirubrobacterales bacterium]